LCISSNATDQPLLNPKYLTVCKLDIDLVHRSFCLGKTSYSVDILYIVLITSVKFHWNPASGLTCESRNSSGGHLCSKADRAGDMLEMVLITRVKFCWYRNEAQTIFPDRRKTEKQLDNYIPPIGDIEMLAAKIPHTYTQNHILFYSISNISNIIIVSIDTVHHNLRDNGKFLTLYSILTTQQAK
jgi:hypothetical protein